jgi:putative ABC transport system permease protein
VVSVQEYLVSAVRPALLVLAGAVACVLLIVGANVSSLILARTLSRRREIAVRSALGASRGRVVRQLVGEVVSLSLVGGGLGLAVAHWGIGLARHLLGPRAEGASLDGSVLAFTLALSVLMGVLTSLPTALSVTGRDFSQGLRGGRTDADSGPRGTWNALILGEVALALVLLVGAGLMVRSLWELWRVDMGFDPRGLLTVEIRIPSARYPEASQQARFFRDVLARVEALPGVDSAAAVDVLPLTGEPPRESALVEGRPSGAPQGPVEIGEVVASPAYRNTMRIPLRRGRDLLDTDGPQSPAVALVSESLARRLWPHRNPIGRRVALPEAAGRSREIVGVVGDVRQGDLAISRPEPTIYIPLSQNPSSWLSLVVRTSRGPGRIARAVADAVQEVDKDLPLGSISSMDEIVADSLYERRVSMVLLATFAGLALVLAAVGIYAVLAFTVGRRAREIGVRLALGAQNRDLLRQIVAEGMRPTLAGIVIGLGVALAVRRALASLLYGVTPSDPATLAAVSSLLVAVAFLSSLLPAFRATRVEIIQSLREE